MGAELDDHDETTQRPSHPQSGAAAHNTGPARGGGYVPPEDNAIVPEHVILDQGPMSNGARISLVMVLAVLGLFIFISPRPWYTLLFVVLSLLPAAPILHFVQKKLHDKAVGRNFLLNQFLLGALTLVLATLFVEWALSTAIGYLVFQAELPAVELILDAEPVVGEDGKNVDMFSALVGIIPVWKLILFFLLIAFFTAGMVEEIGKWLLARRYRKIDADNALLDDNNSARIGCKGILATACMGALGFAASENMGYVLGIALSVRSGLSFRLVGISLLRGLLAYPVHMGTQFFVAVSAAQWYVFKDKSRVAFALFIAVLFHGFFDGVSFVFLILIAAGKVPTWTGALVPVFDVFLIGFLLLLCRGRYKALLERERLVLASDPV